MQILPKQAGHTLGLPLVPGAVLKLTAKACRLFQLLSRNKDSVPVL